MAEAKKDIDYYINLGTAGSGELVLENSIIGILGGQDSGKSVLAASVSKRFAGIPAATLTEIDDVIWLEAEPGSTDSVEGINHRIKEGNVVLLQKYIDEFKGNILEGTTAAFMVARELAKRTGANNLVFDSYSEYSAKLGTWLTNNPKLWESNSGNEDRNKYYRKLLAMNMGVFEEIQAFPGRKIVTVHGKADFSDLEKNPEQKERAIRQDKANNSLASVNPHIEGAAREAFIRKCSLILGTRKIDSGGGKIVRDVTATFNPQVDLATKNRFEFRVAAKPPFNIGEIIKMARGDHLLDFKAIVK